MPILLFLLASLVAASNENNANWKRTVEWTLSHIDIGPLREHYGPDQLANRTRDGVIQLQSRKFRALVVLTLMCSLDTHVTICRQPYVGHDAFQAVHEEMVARGFHAQIVNETCLHLAQLPLPQQPTVDDDDDDSLDEL